MDIDSIAKSIEQLLVETLATLPAPCDLHATCDARGEPSSIADVAIEAELAALLGAISPQAGFLGEEAFRAARRPLAAYATYDELWIVDPIDGTGSFLTGSDTYGTIVAYAKGGVTAAAWIVLPRRQVICCAERGGGVWLNGEQYRLANADRSPASGILATGDFDALELARAERLSAQLQNTRGTVSCAVDYIDLVRGAFDIALYKRTRPWDHAAGVLAYTEAGGHHVNFSGKRYNIFEEMQGLVISPSLQILNEILKFIQYN